ncbi:MAG: hypothetical protein HC934_08700 [Acaryochloridaceae cyanobacterium SU_2_1]|nr:hypothetical protein [Acaryochloridaceae cyanobacterium SU_2_1]
MLKVNPVSTGVKSKEDYYLEDEGLAEEEGLAEYYSPQAEAAQGQGQTATLAQGKTQVKATAQQQQHRFIQAQWYGDGAGRLGLKGMIFKGDFKKVFYGYDLEGERLRGHPQEARSIRSAWAMTSPSPCARVRPFSCMWLGMSGSLMPI